MKASHNNYRWGQVWHWARQRAQALPGVVCTAEVDDLRVSAWVDEDGRVYQKSYFVPARRNQ